MYPPEAAIHLAALVRCGLQDLDNFAVTEFALDDANDAVAFAAANVGPFKLVVIRR
jgi:alcohol dehydrogenase